jgi:hypothetical protein
MDNCFSASTNTRLLWDPNSGPLYTLGGDGPCCAEAASRTFLGSPSSSLCLMGPYRYFPGESAGLFPSSPSLAMSHPSVTASSPSLFIPTPPGFLPLANQQLFRSPRRVSPSSLPGRLSRALSLGTIPSLTRAGKSRLCGPRWAVVWSSWN